MSEDKTVKNGNGNIVANRLQHSSDLYMQVIEAYDRLRVVMDAEASAENGRKNGNGAKDKVAGKAVDKIAELAQALYDAGYDLACSGRQLTAERKKTEALVSLTDGLVEMLGYTGVSAEGENPAIKGTPIWYERLGKVLTERIKMNPGTTVLIERNKLLDAANTELRRIIAEQAEKIEKYNTQIQNHVAQASPAERGN